MSERTITSGILYRDIPVLRESLNEETRTIELAFSSEDPVERMWGVEILDHSPKSVRLGRLADGGPVLVDHDPRDHVGVIEKAEIGSDRRGRAVVRFGKSARAEEIFRDVVDRIRTKVSVGYMIHDAVLAEKKGDTGIYRATDWEPMEVSFVSIPADVSVGVGRADDLKFNIHIEEPNMSENKPEAPQIDARAIENEVRASELQRIRDLENVGSHFKQFGGDELARKCISEGKSVADLNALLIERAGKKAPPSAEIGLDEKEIKQFSFVRAMNAMANPGDRRAQEAAGYEREVSEAAAKKTGKAPQGFLVPVDILRAPTIQMQKRDLTVGTATAGGHTVATELLAASFIDMLRNRMVLQRAGIRTINGLVGNIAIPRQTSGATAYWVAESGSPTESQQAFDQVTMSPKTVGAFTDYSRKLLVQSSIDVESFVRTDIVKVLGLELDRVGLYGTGSSNQPMGVKNTTGINTKDFAANAPTYAEVVDLETLVAADNADVGTLAYIVNATGRGSLKTTEKASGTAQYIWEPGNSVNGYRCEVSNQVASNDFWFGNWDDLILGFWSGVDLTVDPYSGATSGTVRIIALQDVDLAVRHPESFARGNNTL